MSASSAKAKPWEIWLAYVRFSDHPEIGKVRPIVIIDRETYAFIVAKITSAKPRANYQYHELQDWKEEGLLVPSRIQVAPLIALNPKDLLRKKPLGKLSNRDRVAFANLLSQK